MLGWRSVAGAGPGLANLGNTCFLNSVLQCLTYAPPLANLCLDGVHSASCAKAKGDAGFCAFCELEKHVAAAHTLRKKTLVPRALVQRIRSIARHFRPGRQEDAHEFFLRLVERMEEASLAPHGKGLPPAVAQTSEVGQLFGGRLCSKLVCSRCSRASTTYEPFFDLSLELARAPSVRAALKAFTATETLSGANAYRCERCAKRVKATKRLTIHATPHVLALQLKRFGFGRYAGKIRRKIAFDEEIDLGEFTTAGVPSQEKFSLCGVLCHEGASVHSGHYYCHVRASNDTWYQLDDTTVRQVSAKRVLDAEGYMLFYARRPDTAPDRPAARPAAAAADDAGAARARAIAAAIADEEEEEEEEEGKGEEEEEDDDDDDDDDEDYVDGDDEGESVTLAARSLPLLPSSSGRAARRSCRAASDAVVRPADTRPPTRPPAAAAASPRRCLSRCCRAPARRRPACGGARSPGAARAAAAPSARARAPSGSDRRPRAARGGGARRRPHPRPRAAPAPAPAAAAPAAAPPSLEVLRAEIKRNQVAVIAKRAAAATAADDGGDGHVFRRGVAAARRGRAACGGGAGGRRARPQFWRGRRHVGGRRAAGGGAAAAAGGGAEGGAEVRRVRARV